MSSPDSPRDRSRSPKPAAQEHERRSRSPKRAEERSRSPKRDAERSRSPKRDAERDSTSRRRERPREADGAGERTHGARKLEWRREPARPRGGNPMQPHPERRDSVRGGSHRPPDRMDRARHATSGGDQSRARQFDRSRPQQPMGPSSNRRDPGRWAERKPAAWSHDDRQARPAAGSNGASAGRSGACGEPGRSEQVDRWQRDLFTATAGRATAVDDSRRAAFANFEF